MNRLEFSFEDGVLLKDALNNLIENGLILPNRPIRESVLDQNETCISETTTRIQGREMDPVD
jgi:hypothetical protein